MDLARVPLTEKQLEVRMALIEEVMSHEPGPKRWRAAANMMLKLNPVDPDTGKPLTEINAKCIKQNKDFMSGLVNKFGGTHKLNAKGIDNGGIRSFLAMPRAIKYAIESAEPMAFKDKRNAALMFKEFKEYRSCEVY